MYSPELETERLILRRYKESDIDVFHEITTDPRLSDYIYYPSITSEEEIKQIKKFIDNADTDSHEHWLIERKEDNIVVGIINVNNVYQRHNFCTVGYTIRYDYWGNGYAYEALEKVTSHLLNDLNYHLVECVCNENNIKSKRVLEKAGFIKDGYIANRRLNKDGTYSGVEYYSKSK